MLLVVCRMFSALGESLIFISTGYRIGSRAGTSDVGSIGLNPGICRECRCAMFVLSMRYSNMVLGDKEYLSDYILKIPVARSHDIVYFQIASSILSTYIGYIMQAVC